MDEPFYRCNFLQVTCLHFAVAEVSLMSAIRSLVRLKLPKLQTSKIFSSLFILAAHCSTPVKPTFVRIGEWNTQDDKDCTTEDDLNEFCADPVIDNNVIAIIVHPSYRKGSTNKYNDIALLQMAKKVKFTAFVSPICLPLDPSLRTLNFTGHTFDVAGWGNLHKFIIWI